MKHNTLEPSEQDESLAPLFLSQKGSCQYINTRWSIWIYIYIPQQICDTHFSGCIIHGCLQFRTICCQLVMFRSLDAGQYNPPWTLGFFLMLNIIDWPRLTLQQKNKTKYTNGHLHFRLLIQSRDFIMGPLSWSCQPQKEATATILGRCLIPFPQCQICILNITSTWYIYIHMYIYIYTQRKPWKLLEMGGTRWSFYGRINDDERDHHFRIFAAESDVSGLGSL